MGEKETKLNDQRGIGAKDSLRNGNAIKLLHNTETARDSSPS